MTPITVRTCTLQHGALVRAAGGDGWLTAGQLRQLATALESDPPMSVTLACSWLPMALEVSVDRGPGYLDQRVRWIRCDGALDAVLPRRLSAHQRAVAARELTDAADMLDSFRGLPVLGMAA